MFSRKDPSDDTESIMDYTARRRASSILKQSNGKPMVVEPVVLPPLTEPGEEKPVRKANWFLAPVVLLLEVALATAEGQFSSIGFTTKEYQFEAPFFYTQWRFMARSLAFPVVVLIMWIVSWFSKEKFNLVDFTRKCSRVTGEQGLTWWTFFRFYTLPTLTVLGTGVTYMVALKYVPTSVTSACFASTVAMAYILSILFLKHPHLIVKTIFVIISFAGVAMVAYATSTGEQIKSDAYIGIIMVMASCVCLSLHQLFYTKSFPNADQYQAAYTVTIMFGVCSLIYWPVPLVLRLMDIEIWYWAKIPWGFLLGGIFSSLGVAFFYAFGLAISSPFFISLGELLTLALSAVTEYFIRNIQIYPLQIVGSCIIALAFVVLILPDRILSVNLQRFRKAKYATTTGTIPPMVTSESTITLAELSKTEDTFPQRRPNFLDSDLCGCTRSPVGREKKAKAKPKNKRHIKKGKAV